MLALRPACASWIEARAPCDCTIVTIRAQASACSSFQMPASSGLMRPSGTTAAASVVTRPKPPVAWRPRLTRCQSVGTPSCFDTEYWHIGESQMRLRAVRPRRVRGSRREVTCETTGDRTRSIRLARRLALRPGGTPGP